MPYLTNQEGLNHEDNFYGFYTQEGVQENWNLPKILADGRAEKPLNCKIHNFLLREYFGPIQIGLDSFLSVESINIILVI